MKVVFMGTPTFAVGCLKRILDSEHSVVGVITSPDKEAGRGRKIHQSAVKEFALENGLKLMQPKNLKSEEFVDELKSLNADIFVVVAFRMLPKVVWQIPEKGTFNLHASLLPQYRGAAPINWAIINGEEKTGVTTFLIDEKIDTGNILLQKETEIEKNETAGTLHDKLMLIGSDLIVDTLNGIENQTIKAKPQNQIEEFKDAPKIKKEDCKIDWHQSLESIDYFIRGFSPYPAAWTNWVSNEKNLTMKIFGGEIIYTSHQNLIGEVVLEKKSFKIATKDGFYIPTEILLQGKKKMQVNDFVNGLNLSEKYRVS